MTNLNGIYKHKGYGDKNMKINPIYTNMQTVNSEFSDFNIKNIDRITQLNYLTIRPNSFEYSMDIVYDNNNESSYIITINNKNNKPVIIPFYARVEPCITKYSINCNDFAITKIEEIYDVNARDNMFNDLYYKWRFLKIYYVFNYTKYNGKYLISNVFYKHVNEVFPKEGFEKIKEKLAFIENFQRAPHQYGVLQNYKNRNGEAAVVENFVRNAYKRVSDTLGTEKYQSAPLYKEENSKKPSIYGRDGSLVSLESSDTVKMVKVNGISSQNSKVYEIVVSCSLIRSLISLSGKSCLLFLIASINPSVS